MGKVFASVALHKVLRVPEILEYIWERLGPSIPLRGQDELGHDSTGLRWAVLLQLVQDLTCESLPSCGVGPKIVFDLMFISISK